MLVYHPAFDLNHGMFRLIRLLETSPNRALKWDTYRILDFYYLFPDLLASARLPRTMTSRKKAYANFGSKYSRVPSPRMFIQQMIGIHETVGRSLVGKGFIDASSYDARTLIRTEAAIPPDMSYAIETATADSELVAMLAVEMAAIPLTGLNGLKDRTGLLEHRYDSV